MVSVWRGFLFLWVFGMDYVILLWHFMSLPYNYFDTETVSLNGNFDFSFKFELFVITIYVRCFK